MVIIQNDLLLLLTSGFRSDAVQRELFEAEVKKLMANGSKRDVAEEVVDDWIAHPGHGPHRTGRAVDLKISTTFRNSKHNVSALKGTPCVRIDVVGL